MEIFGKVFAASRILFLGNIDTTVIMATPVVHCSKLANFFYGENEIAAIKLVMDHF